MLLYYKSPNATLYFGDCGEVIPDLPVHRMGIVTDPPYGVGLVRRNQKVGGPIIGDEKPPDIRWMANCPAIVWGGNNFCDQLPRSTGWLVWYKHLADCANNSQAELAWTNTVKTIRHFELSFRGFTKAADGWHHPAQKPVALMAWCIGKMPEECRTIFDPYMGSGSTGVAAVRLGRHFVGCEIDERHIETATRRIVEAEKSFELFGEQRPIETAELFA